MGKMKRRVVSILLTAMLTVGTMSGFTPVAAAESEEKKSEPTVQGTPGVDYVEGEAIVCYKTEPDDVKAEDAVRSDVEEILEKEDGIEDADALLVLEDVDEAVISGETEAEGSTGVEEKETADIANAGEDADGEAEDEQEETPGVITLVKSDHLTTKELIAELEQQENVLYAEPNYTYKLQSTDLSGDQWESTGTYGIGVDGWNTYNEGQPTPAVDTSEQVIAIIDTGVDYNHEDLHSVMWNDGLNYPELVEMGGGMYGFNAVEYDSFGRPDDSTDPMDTYGHGTHCAGTVAAAWNGTGVSGVTSGARIMAVRIFNDLLSLHADEMIRAYEYVIAAKKAGVNVVATNNSYGGSITGVTESLILEEAGKQGIVCVFAAGNENKDLDMVNYSSSLRGRFGHVVVVGASSESGKRAAFSNYGNRDVDVFAPGVNIWSTLPMGTAGPNPDTPVLTQGGKTYVLDYSSKTTVEDELFGLETEDSEFSVITAGDGKNVLHAESKANRLGWISFHTKTYEDISDCYGILIRLWTDKEQGITYEVQEGSEWGETKLKTGSVYLQPGLNDISIPYPYEEYSDTNKQNVWFNIVLESANEDIYGELDAVNIREIRLTNTMENYECWNGTSMATPVVTGAIAILSAVYPEDSPEKLAARVTGSVQRNDYLEEICASGGLFRLDKAIDGDTFPVPGRVSVNDGTFTVEGFFFGEEKGTLKLGETECTVSSWTDTRIVAALPENYEPGEYMVEVTSAKGMGHRRLRMGTAKSLTKRLTLPGSTFAEDGTYVVSDEAMKKYRDFYSGDVKALVAVDGCLYAVFSTMEGGTAVYRYSISSGLWEELCVERGFRPICGVAWNGKIILHGANPPENKAAIGLLDPETGKIKWNVYDQESYEELTSMVNNGYGIYLIGGRKAIYGNDKNSMDNGSIRQVDPVKLTVSELEDDEVGPSGYSLTFTSTEDGILYYGTGASIGKPLDVEFYSFMVNGGKSADISHIKNEKLFEDIYQGATASCTAVATKNGLLLTGPFEVDENDVVITDTWLLSYDGKSVKKQAKVFSQREISNPVSVGYRGRFYILGQTMGETTPYLFSSVKADVAEPYGEYAYQDEWVNGIRYGKNGFRTRAYPEKAVWKKDSGQWKYQTGKDKYLKNCWAKIDGKWYYFDRDGFMEKNAYRKGYRLGSSGAWDGKAAAPGWKQDKTGWWYSLGKGQYLKNCWAKIDGSWYYFDKTGYAVSSAFVKGWWIGKNCICSYKYQSKWKKDKTGWWYGDSSGWYAKSATYTIDGVKYAFDAKGYCVNP